ncbi:MAG: hypothetical protein ACR2ND_04935, partial [Solirubrobacteraceae bacterium]
VVVMAALGAWKDVVAVPPLLDGAGSSSSTAVVGGFVRDTLLGRDAREIDLLVEGDAGAVAQKLAAHAGARVVSHPRFDTYNVSTDHWQVDIAAARTESYPRPGALPEVQPASIEQDLLRRDFTVNAIALRAGELVAVHDAFDDLAARRLRALHVHSFEDDPTRLVRLARYAERLGFTIERRTGDMAAAATLAGLSPARLGRELRLAVREPDPSAVLARLPLGFDIELAARALSLAPADADRELILLAACARAPAIEATSAERAVLERDSAALGRRMQRCGAPSELWQLLRAEAPESVALAGARSAPEAARRWFEELREVRLEITGEDLLAAGIEAGPRIGVLLEEAVRARLDGELGSGGQEQLQFVVESAGR